MSAYLPLHEAVIPELPNYYRGKVRENYDLPDGRRILISTDRLSAFDRAIAAIPLKGQVLTQTARYWFERTADICPNHVLEYPDPNVVVGKRLEFVGRGKQKAVAPSLGDGSVVDFFEMDDESALEWAGERHREDGSILRGIAGGGAANEAASGRKDRIRGVRHRFNDEVSADSVRFAHASDDDEFCHPPERSEWRIYSP